MNLEQLRIIATVIPPETIPTDADVDDYRYIKIKEVADIMKQCAEDKVMEQKNTIYNRLLKIRHELNADLFEHKDIGLAQWRVNDIDNLLHEIIATED